MHYVDEGSLAFKLLALAIPLSAIHLSDLMINVHLKFLYYLKLSYP